MFVENLQKQFPKSGHYFKEHYEEQDYPVIWEAFRKLPFDYQLGVYLRFFDDVNMDVQLYSINSEILQESILYQFNYNMSLI